LKELAPANLVSNPFKNKITYRDPLEWASMRFLINKSLYSSVNNSLYSCQDSDTISIITGGSTSKITSPLNLRILGQMSMKYVFPASGV